MNSSLAGPKGPKLDDYQSLAEFRYQIRRFLRFSEDEARKNQLEPRHHQLMLAVKGVAPGSEPHIGYLAERLQIRHHSAVELVDRLAAKGLIKRVRSAGDHREVLVRLTSRGERKLATLTTATRAELRSAAPTLVRTLRRITGGASVSGRSAGRALVAGKAREGEGLR